MPGLVRLIYPDSGFNTACNLVALHVLLLFFVEYMHDAGAEATVHLRTYGSVWTTVPQHLTVASGQRGAALFTPSSIFLKALPHLSTIGLCTMDNPRK